MGLPKLTEKKTFFSGGIIRLFEDVNLVFSGSMLNEILEKHNLGYSLEEISEYLNRDPDEIFLALFHLARQGYEIRPLGKRLK